MPHQHTLDYQPLHHYGHCGVHAWLYIFYHTVQTQIELSTINTATKASNSILPYCIYNIKRKLSDNTTKQRHEFVVMLPNYVRLSVM